MIKNLKKALERCYSDGTRGSELSICSVFATNIVYLVFSKDGNAPDFAVRPLIEQRDYDRFNQDILLYRNLGCLVAEPIKEFNFGGLDYSLHRGIVGVPWFKLKYLYSKANDWAQLRQLALKALYELNEKLLNADGMKVYFNLEDAVSSVLTSFAEYSPELYEKYKDRINSALAHLEGLDGIRLAKQHGDFCLNNLIFDNNRCTIVDFEDFGQFNIPCYDAITLALSLNEGQPSPIKWCLRDEIYQCIDTLQMDIEISKDQLDALYLLYLLSRLGFWSSPIGRKSYRERLVHNLVLYFEAGAF